MKRNKYYKTAVVSFVLFWAILFIYMGSDSNPFNESNLDGGIGGILLGLYSTFLYLVVFIAFIVLIHALYDYSSLKSEQRKNAGTPKPAYRPTFWNLSFVLSCLFFTVGYSDNGRDMEDIYDVVPKKSKLTLALLKESERIIVNGNDLIILYKPNGGYAERHLLFYNKALELYAATSVPIDEIFFKNDTFSGTQLRDVEFIQKHTRNDLPKKYTFNFVKNDYKSSQGVWNKIIERIEFDPALNALLYIKEDTGHLYSCDNLDTNSAERRKMIDSQFVTSSTIKTPISNLFFEYAAGDITMHNPEQISLPEVKCTIMNRGIMDSFYERLYHLLSSRRQ